MIAKDARIAVIGAGAIGGVTAAFLKKAGWNPLIVCKHQETADLCISPGMRIRGIKGDHTVALQALKDISDMSDRQDLVFLATKANDCLTAAQALLAFLKPESLVVSLQNGLCEDALAEILGRERVIGCVVGWGATNRGAADLEVTSEGEFVIGNIDQQTYDRLSPLKEMLDAVYPTRITDNIIGELYSKLIINACINSLGVIGGVKLGQLLASKKARQIFVALMREAMAVAEAMKIKVAPGGGGKLDYYKFLDAGGKIADLRRSLTIRIIGFKYRRIKSSSLQSLERGRRTEIDYLNGYICDKGKTLGVPTPFNDAVRAMVLAIENGEKPMSPGNLTEITG
ncbi:MAG: 2-dehydropantoate 2-reductase [Deltaproteobacteria bacterium]|jgi:2-dehydropantoate 2-reductase|nr:2-dehydropantoate 2-reductase [Deltaproteobacteria bacterium]